MIIKRVLSVVMVRKFIPTLYADYGLKFNIS